MNMPVYYVFKEDAACSKNAQRSIVCLVGTTVSTWRPKVTSSKTNASSWSTSTSWRQTRLARSFWRKFFPCGDFKAIVSCYFPLIISFFFFFFFKHHPVTKLRLVVQRQRRPANAEKSVSWPRKKRSWKICPRRRNPQRNESKLKFWLDCHLVINLYEQDRFF